MQPASAAREATVPSIGSEDLAEGLMLVRASALKIIRLQLAMERRDQRVAQEAVDDLLALDRCLQEFLTHYPIPHGDGLFGNVLELERSALNVEKHTLAAGISNRGWQVAAPAPDASDDASIQEWAAPTSEPYEFETPSWWRWTAIVLLVVGVAVACLAYFLGVSGAVPNWLREVL
jgi:hypothetical protein